MKKQEGVTLIELLIGIAFMIAISIFIGTCYVAFHFITKFW